jgi:CheY-like chemotaxis protein
MNDDTAANTTAAKRSTQDNHRRLDELQKNILNIHQHVQQQINLRQRNTKPKVLVVDGNEQLLDSITDFLAKREILTVSTINGLEALHHFHNKHFDLVLTAINVRGINGNTLARYIKSQTKTIPVIAHTSSVWLAEESFDAILKKPIKLEILFQQIMLQMDIINGQLARPQH